MPEQNNLKNKKKAVTNKTSEAEKRNIPGAVAIILTLAIVGFIFVSLCCSYFTVGFFLKHRMLCTMTAYLLVGIATILAFFFYFVRNDTAYKLTISVFILLDFLLIVFFCFLKTGFLNIVHDVDSFKEYLDAAGAWKDVLFIVLQYLQVIILPIPSFVTLVAGTALFGAVKCFIYSFIAIVLGSLTAFFIGRFLGYKAVAWIVGKDALDNWQKKLKGKDNFILTAMFILPLFPDDILCFIAGLSSMTTKYFIFMIIIARAIAISTTCFSFDFIPFNTWWGILCWILIAALVIAMFIIFYKNHDKIQKWLDKHGKKKLEK